MHKAMLVAASPRKPENLLILRRWFADANSTDEQLAVAAQVLNDGLKKIAVRIRSTFLLFMDMPINRGDASKANVNAFVFGNEKIDVIYVEAAFFSDRDMFKSLKNWTRIVVHELSHREVKTKDHRYRHHSAGLKPDAGGCEIHRGAGARQRRQLGDVLHGLRRRDGQRRLRQSEGVA